MSKISITPNASGTGVFTISSPATNTNRTLTLPDEAGTVLTSASTSNFPAGSVIQVVGATPSTANISTTSTSDIDLSFSATITVKEASSIFISFFGSFYSPSEAGSWSSTAFMSLYRDTTKIAQTEHTGGETVGGSTATPSIIFLDAGLSAGTYTYSIKGRSTTGGTIYFFRSTQRGGLVLQEIAG
jgi:hypothetical protein